MSEELKFIDGTIFKITQQVKESEENFIFQTLKSYSENIVEREIDKQELTRAICNYFNPDYVYREDAGLLCERCRTVLHYPRNKIMGLDYIYCYKCGRRMKRR